MAKFNLFILCISVLFTITCIYLGLTDPRVNPLSITMFIVVGIGLTIIYSSKVKGDK